MVMESNLARWEAFDWDRHPHLRPAKRIIVDWYNALPDSGAIVLAGDVGCGKTHLAEAIADLYGRWRISCFSEMELIKAIQASYGGAGNEEDIIKGVLRADLAILDDLGTYNTSNIDWLHNIYGRIFDEFVTVRKKPILITTNLPFFGECGIEQRIGARSFSRLCDAIGHQSRYIDFFGVSDYRIERMIGG